MLKKIIIANWKMNPQTSKEAERILAGYDKWLTANSYKLKADVVICPPFVYLENLKLKTRNLKLSLGAQDIFWENPLVGGAFTGEISAFQLKNLKCGYVIIGHSERRKYLGETDDMVNKKILTSLKAGLNVILCVGEQQRENSAEIPKMVEEQVLSALQGVQKSSLDNIIVAYEPIWAIGTGIPDTPEGAMAVAVLIRKTAVGIFGPPAKNMRVIYGGSVNAFNARQFISQDGIDGVLVGGASLDPEEFAKIVLSVSN